MVEVAAWPKLCPVVVGALPKLHGVLGGKDAIKVFLRHVVKFSDEFVLAFSHAVE